MKKRPYFLLVCAVFLFFIMPVKTYAWGCPNTPELTEREREIIERASKKPAEYALKDCRMFVSGNRTVAIEKENGDLYVYAFGSKKTAAYENTGTNLDTNPKSMFDDYGFQDMQAGITDLENARLDFLDAWLSKSDPNDLSEDTLMQADLAAEKVITLLLLGLANNPNDVMEVLLSLAGRGNRYFPRVEVKDIVENLAPYKKISLYQQYMMSPTARSDDKPEDGDKYNAIQKIKELIFTDRDLLKFISYFTNDTIKRLDPEFFQILDHDRSP